MHATYRNRKINECITKPNTNAKSKAHTHTHTNLNRPQTKITKHFFLSKLIESIGFQKANTE